MTATRPLTPLLQILFLAGLLLFIAAPSLASDWVRTGPYGGNIPSLAFSAADTNVILAGTVHGGLWLSSDAGCSWNGVNALQPPYPETRSVISLNPLSNEFWISTTNGLLLFSVDQNLISPITNGLPQGVGTIEVVGSPVDITTLFVIAMAQPPDTVRGLYKSTDDGESWMLVETIPHTATNNPSGIFSITDDEPHLLVQTLSGTFTSYDDGMTWQQLNAIPAILGYELAWDRSMDGHLLMYASSPYYSYVLVESFDGGASWSQYKSSDVAWNEVYSFYQDALGYLYAENRNGLVRSINFGQSWEPIGETFQSDIDRSSCWLVNPLNPKGVFLGYENGLFKSNDGGESFYETNEGIIASSIQALEWSRSNPDRLIAVTFFGVWISDDRGRTWSERKTDEFLWLLVEAPNDKDTWYAAGDKLLRSRDDGDTWSVVHVFQIPQPRSLVIDPKDDHRILLGDVMGNLWESTDAGQSFLAIQYRTEGGTQTNINRILMSRFHDPWIILGQSGVYISDDNGSTWNLDYRGELEHMTVFDLETTPDESAFYASAWEIGNYVFASASGPPQEFQIVSNHFQSAIVDIEINPNIPNQVYVSLTDTLLMTEDGGVHWTFISDEIPTSGNLAISPVHGSIAIGSGSMGVWVNEELVSTEESYYGLLPNRASLELPFPNPFNSSTTIRVLPSKSDEVYTLSIFDALGREVQNFHNGPLNSTRYFVWTAEAFTASGTYFLQLKSHDSMTTRRITLLR